MNVLDYEGLQVLINEFKYLSNDNILINSNFKINQRDGYITKLGIVVYSNKELTNIVNDNLSTRYNVKVFSKYATYTFENNTFYVSKNDIEKGYCNDFNLYTVDRWKFNDAKNTLLINDDYVTLIGEDETCVNGLQQNVENYKDYAGKTCVFSAMIRARNSTNVHIQMHDGKTYHIFNYNINTEWKLVFVKAKLAKDITRLKVEIGIKKLYTGTIDIKWTKLELNESVTPYIPPDPIIELLRCKRYYQRIGASSLALIINATSIAAFTDQNLNYIDFYYELNYPLRINPYKYSFYGIENSDEGYSIGSINGNSIVEGFTYDLKASYDRFRVTAHIDPNVKLLKYPDSFLQYHLIFYSNSGVELDAEIYY